MPCFPCAFEKMYELGWKNRRSILCAFRSVMGVGVFLSEGYGGIQTAKTPKINTFHFYRKEVRKWQYSA